MKKVFQNLPFVSVKIVKFPGYGNRKLPLFVDVYVTRLFMTNEFETVFGSMLAVNSKVLYISIFDGIELANELL